MSDWTDEETERADDRAMMAAVDAALPDLRENAWADAFAGFDRKTRQDQESRVKHLIDLAQAGHGLSCSQWAAVYLRAASAMYAWAGTPGGEVARRLDALMWDKRMLNPEPRRRSRSLTWGQMTREEQAFVARRLPLRVPYTLVCQAAELAMWLCAVLSAQPGAWANYVMGLLPLLREPASAENDLRINEHLSLSVHGDSLPASLTKAARRTMRLCASAAVAQKITDAEWAEFWNLMALSIRRPTKKELAGEDAFYDAVVTVNDGERSVADVALPPNVIDLAARRQKKRA